MLSAFGFGGLVYGLSSFGQETAGPSATTWVAFVVGAVGLAAFVGRQLVLQRDDRALLDLRTFRFRTFTASSVLMMLMMAVLLGAIVLLPIYMQTVQGLPPLTTGLLLLPGGLLMGLLGPVVGRLYDRFGARALLLPGTVVTSLALWSATLLEVHSPAAQILVFHLLLARAWRSCSPRCSPRGWAPCRHACTPTAARSSVRRSSWRARRGWRCW